VVVLPSENFIGDGVLNSLLSSTGSGINTTMGIYEDDITTIDPDLTTSADGGTIDRDDNGIFDGNPNFPEAVVSDTVTLAINTEETDISGIDGIGANAINENSNLTVDFGFVPLVSIGSTVWNDSNNDGIYQDVSERPLEGITVKLYMDENMDGQPDGGAIQMFLTDAKGNYLFDNLLEGNYVLGVTPPDSLPLSSTPVIGEADNHVDNNDNGIQGVAGEEILSTTINLTANDEPSGEMGAGGDQDNADDNNGDMTVDFGLVPLAVLGDYVWLDSNNDGVQDMEEDGVEGVTVYLRDEHDMIIDSTLTGIDGLYEFTGLIPGEYSVQFVWPDSVNGVPVAPVDPDQGGDDTLDSDADTGTGITSTIILGPGDNYMDLDAGVEPILSGLGDYVWHDEDRNGVQDADEESIENVLVILNDVLGNAIDSMATDVNGFYFFEDLFPGDYTLTFVPLDTLTGLIPEFTGADMGVDYEDSDVDSNGRTGIITLPPNVQDLTIDAGVYYKTFDLALIKELDASVLQPLMPGNAIIYNLTIYNQGESDAYEVQVQDFIPEGLILDDIDWTESDGIATMNTRIPHIPVSEEEVVQITFQLDPNFMGTSIINNAEIYSASIVAGSSNRFGDNSGFLDGERFTERKNYYHKPVANLNWDFDINQVLDLSTVLYASWGRGGGTGGQDADCNVFGNFLEPPVAPDACGGDVSVTWQLTDGMGMVFFTCTATFSVSFDIEAPSCPSNWDINYNSDNINCTAPPYNSVKDLENETGADIVDNCSSDTELLLTYVDSLIHEEWTSGGSNYFDAREVIRTYKIEDACGRDRNLWIYRIYVVDVNGRKLARAALYS